jgi:EAL domain-containing protein (putative c-di-GMP-specific phosphodiesterase class I)/ActR/RegA family two-component response regulator
VKDLLDAILEPGGLSVRFQPIVEVHGDDWRLHGVECLMRGPRGTNLESAEILFDYVRRKREESLVDRACVRTAFAAVHELPGLTRVSVNVHASTLGRDRSFVAFLVETAKSNELSLDRLTVEIVEHAPPWDGRSFLLALEEVRECGACIALDDVGLGYSNFRMILDSRPHYLKVDRYFPAGCHRDPLRRAVLESIQQLASKFGSRVVAEGVEELDDLRAVTATGIELVQGQCFCAAVPASVLALSRFLQTGAGFVSAPGRRRGRSLMAAAAAVPGTRKRVLLVDDSATILMMEKMILLRGPYDVVTARDGMEALEKAREARPDLILLDVVMPRMDGFETCRQLRAEEATRDIPVIFVTTRGEAENVAIAFESGASDHVTKPINAAELLAKLRSHLGD